jgi:hypothetical protein
MWTVADGVPLRDAPYTGKLLRSLPMYHTVSETGRRDTVRGAEFAEVSHTDGKTELTGWVYVNYLAPYNDTRQPVLKITNATPNPHDAGQYMTWQGRTQYNLCGFLAVMYCAGWDADAADYLDYLKGKRLSFMTRIFPSWQGRGTTVNDLDIMFSDFEGYDVPLPRIGTLLFDKVAGRTLLHPQRMADILRDSRVIYSVRIDRRTGYLSRSGILHWVVLESVHPADFGRGAVVMFNPYSNSMEAYDFAALVESGGVPYGVAVRR